MDKGIYTKDQCWHVLPVSDVFKQLETSSQGLSYKEVRERKRIFGPNQLKELKRPTALIRFLRQFHNILIYILLISAVATILLRHWVDMSVILGVVVLNALIGFIQEGKAEKALSAIRHLLSPQATIVRDGKRATISAKSLVPGDVVLLQSGDKVPADLRLFNVRSLQIQEAVLTGESHAAAKSADAVSETATLGDRTSMAYSSTLVTYGRGEGIVVATGQQTELGRISSLIARVPSLTTPLLKQIGLFGRWLTAAILLLSAITFLIGVFVWGDKSSAMVMAIVGLAVAAIPEGLPAIMTITLAIGVTRMAKRHAIIRRLPAVETMGSVTTICTDKTGTLTRNELAVQKVVTAEHIYHVTGSGYNATGQFHLNDELFPLEEHNDLKQLIQTAILCNDAQLIKVDEQWALQGNPVDGALLALGLKAKFDLKFEKESYPNTDLIPFESEHKFMASLNHDHQGRGCIFVKGAPEKIVSKCQMQRYQGKDIPIDIDYWHEHLNLLAEKGHRVVAVAMRETHADHRELNFNDIQGLTLLGFVGLVDPPREEAIHAVSQCQRAGIKVKMITGDHAVTARYIAEQVGIGNQHGVLTGEELNRMDDAYLEKMSQEVDVYARTSPEHKLRLVKALQANGHVVSMTGDGVNDAPALKQAEIGVAMGQKGTEATKEVAEMVLTDDNFASIHHAIEEGRTVYDNLKKAILYILPTSFGEAFIIVMAIVLGRSLPITAVQILWVNMITAVTLALSLGFEPAEENVMRRPPRAPKTPILSGMLIWRIIFVSALMVVAGFGVYVYERHLGADLATARCTVVNMMVAAEAVYLFNCRRIHSSSFSWRVFFGSAPVLIAVGLVAVFQLLFTYLPGMDHFFGVSPIGLLAWGRIILFAVIIFVLVELEKKLLGLRVK